MSSRVGGSAVGVAVGVAVSVGVGVGEVVGVVTVADFKALSKAQREADTVSDLMVTDLPRLAAELSAFDALVELDTGRASAALVESADGTHVVSREDFASAMEMRRLAQTDEPF